MVLVTGATGTVGRAVAAQLTARGAAWRAYVRDASRIARPPGGGVAVGDLDDGDAFGAALEGVVALFLLSKPSAGMAARERRIAAMARVRGVERIVRMSVMAADAAALSPIRRWHGDAEAAVAESGPLCASLRANFLMQNLNGFRRPIESKGAFSLPAADARVSMVDVADVAEAATRLLTDPASCSGPVTLTGPAALGFAEAAAAIAGRLGRPARYVPDDPEPFVARMIAAGSPPWRAEALAALYTDFRAGLNAPVHPDLETLLGRPRRSLAEALGDGPFRRET